MYLRTIATAAVAGLLLIGCSDQSSINSPAGESVKMTSLAKLSNDGKFELDQTVVDEVTGESYVVSGTIYYDYQKDGGDYSLLVNPFLEVRNSLAVRKQKMSFDAKNYFSGIIEEEQVALEQQYRLVGISENLILRVVFNAGEEISISAISIFTDLGNIEEAK
jgi:hypothetical protein